MKLIRLVGEITYDIFAGLVYFLQVNLRYVANIIEIMLPYVMYVMGQELAIERGRFAVGGEIFVPIVVCVVIHYIREIGYRFNTGSRIPIPEKRFTEVGDDGEVSVPNSRVQEMLLYVAELEDWMERKRWL